jgi:hypothetical protein
MWISVRSRADGVQGSLEGIPPMRWTDLPPDSGPADGRAAALPRGEWEELRRRLERLPDGHPSRPDDEPDASADAAVDEGDGPPRPVDPRGGEPVDPERHRRGPEGPGPGHAKPGALGDVGGRGEREPYRPWFSEGEPPEPWFAVEPD